MKIIQTFVAAIVLLTAFATMAQTYGRISQNDDYLLSQKERIRLSLTKCPGGDRRIFVIGNRPDTNRCVNLHYHVRDQWGGHVDHDRIKNYVGGASCYGDSKPIQNLGNLPIEQLQVSVDDVSYCD